MMNFKMGNLPPKSKVQIQLTFYRTLEIEDLSYVIRVPMTYIPKYMGNFRKYILKKTEKEDVEMKDFD